MTFEPLDDSSAASGISPAPRFVCAGKETGETTLSRLSIARLGLYAAMIVFSARRLRADEEPLVIGQIEIRTLDVYDDEEARHGWAYAATNALHVRTQEAVIRKFLLFEEGDVYSPERLAETERNLRALEFLKSATVTAGAPHNGVVDILVETQDSWSTEPGISLSSKGGVADWGMEFTESNFLGTGRYFSVLYESDPDRTKKGFKFRDPALFGPYWYSQLLYTDNSDGREESLTLNRGFNAVETPWAVNVNAQRVEQITKRYADTYVSDEFNMEREAYGASWAHSFKRTERSAHRVGAGFSFIDEEFTDLEDGAVGTRPEDRLYRYLFVDYQFFESRYRKLNFVSRDLRYEDFSLGTDFRLRLGVSPTALGAGETTGMVASSLSRGFEFGPGSFIRPTLSYSSRLGTDARNEIFHFDTLFVHKLPTSLPQTFVSRLAITQGRDLDHDVQFFADAGTGLRGYRLWSYEGDATVIANFEHRLYLGRELFQLISPGVAFFFDTGTATSQGRPFSLGDFHSDVGVGLRFGLVRSGRNMFRVDFAWPFDPDPRGRQGLIVSFSSAHAF